MTREKAKMAIHSLKAIKRPNQSTKSQKDVFFYYYPCLVTALKNCQNKEKDTHKVFDRKQGCNRGFSPDMLLL